jgi:hypothetical protein
MVPFETMLRTHAVTTESFCSVILNASHKLTPMTYRIRHCLYVTSPPSATFYLGSVYSHRAVCVSITDTIQPRSQNRRPDQAHVFGASQVMSYGSFVYLHIISAHNVGSSFAAARCRLRKPRPQSQYQHVLCDSPRLSSHTSNT